MIEPIVCVDCYSLSNNKTWWEPSNKNCPECQTQMFRTRFPHFVTETILPRIPIKCPDGCSTEIMWPEFENHKKYCGQLIYTCNSCIQITKKCYHCTICENFDLCMKCYSRYGHPHKMTKNAFNYGRITRATENYSTKNENPDHQAYGGLFIYNCNKCGQTIEKCYHCTICDDFDLCVKCYSHYGHPHKMERFLAIKEVSDIWEPDPTSSAIQRSIQSLEHASRCRDGHCHSPSCQGMKRIISHYKNCKCQNNGGCKICKQFIALCCSHAKVCQETKCPVQFCQNIKEKLGEQQLQQRLQAVVDRVRKRQLMQKRVALSDENSKNTSPNDSSAKPF